MLLLMALIQPTFEFSLNPFSHETVKINDKLLRGKNMNTWDMNTLF